MLNYTFLLIGIVYTTFLPGFVFTELFLPKLQFYKKIPLYLLLSTIVSSYVSYFAALVFGLNRITLTVCFCLFLVLFVFLIIKKKPDIYLGLKKNVAPILVGSMIYVIFFTALYPAIFRFYNGYFVMSGPNWQDTAMHLSIIESLSQGNFPPLAPYFSGHALSYYYFSDLHAAIINTFYGGFFPQVLTLINPFFAMLFFFSVYALAFSITKRKFISIMGGIMATFYGNIGFVNLIQELLKNNENYFSLLKNNSYSSNQSILQMVPMADYFLQNRPMMVGLSAVVIVIILLNSKKYLIAGIITAALLKFQFFGFLVSWIFFGVMMLLKFIQKETNLKDTFKNGLLFLLPTLIFGLLFATGKVGERTLVGVFLDSFTWGPWQKSSPLWFVQFAVQNLNIGIILSIFVLFSRKIRENKKLQPVFLTLVIIFSIPFIMRFTIYPFDMFKFFYYAIPFICVVVASFYSQLKHQKLALFVFCLVLLVSSLTSINMLMHSYLNKTMGYSLADYQSGMWIRDNTPQKSVFVTMPTVHSAPTDIGGRLRVISYINWPYSHGFNVGEDNVFSRVSDVETVYKTGDVEEVRVKYDARYVFYGSEERSNFPGAEKLFDSSSHLTKIYNSDGILIYKII